MLVTTRDKCTHHYLDTKGQLRENENNNDTNNNKYIYIYIYIYTYIFPLNVYRRSHDSALLTVKERVINLKLNYSNFELH